MFELANVMNKSDLEPGYDYNVISISIDEFENPEKASVKKKEMLSGFDKEISPDSWRFLTGSIENIKTMTDAAGFYFKREDKELRHAGTLIFIDKDGKICRYLFPVIQKVVVMVFYRSILKWQLLKLVKVKYLQRSQDF